MQWNMWCNIAGAVAIIGPILLVVWYIKAVKQKINKLNQAN